MDNRRMSVRAEAGSSVPSRSYTTPVPLLDRALELTRLNWELLFFVGVLALTIFTRLWDLGPRAFHHDESIHAYFSNYYLKTGNFTTTGGFQGGYDPTYHGPFLYTVTALDFFLFGASDGVARLGPAIFGILLVGLCWFLRPFIGRLASMIAAFLVLISPSITYYSRSLRHDIFALVGLMMAFLGIVWFVRTHKGKWLYLASVGFAITYASHELAYIVAIIFVGYLVIAAFADQAFSDGMSTASLFVIGGGAILTILSFVIAVMLQRNAGSSLIGVLAFVVSIGIVAAGAAFMRGGGSGEVSPVRSALASLLTQRWTLIGVVVTFLAIYVVLFTNMLTKPQLIFSGITGLIYWLQQQQVQRGGQPVFYYGMLMPIYEPLALFAGFGTLIYMLVAWARGGTYTADPGDEVNDPNRGALVDDYGHDLPSSDAVRGFALSFLAFWSFGAFIAFSLAGERLPWLNMQIALPVTLLAAAGLGKMLQSIRWREVWKGGGAFLGVAVVLFIFAAFAFVSHLNGSMPAPTGDASSIQMLLRGVLLLVFTLGLLVFCGWLAYKLMPGRAVKVIGLTFAVLLAIYGIRSMDLANFSHGDVPVEMLIYTQSAPDTKTVSDMILRLSRDETAFDSNRNPSDPTGGHGLSISIDQNEAIEWPFDWYLRDMRSLSYFNYFTVDANGQTAEKPDDQKANLIAPNAPVILVSESTENTAYLKNLIAGKYTTNKYVLNWWFPEEGTYKVGNQGDLGQAMSWLMSKGMRYLLYRDPGVPVGSRNFYLHVRNDLAVKVGLGAPTGSTSTGTTPGTGPTANGPTYGLLDLPPSGVERGQFSLPRGVATGPDGSFYVVDTANMRVEKFDKSGKFVSIIGNGKGSGDGQFNAFSDTATGTGPGGIAVDKAGNIYVADTWNHRIEKFDSTGKFVTKWGEFINISDPGAAGDSQANSKFFGPRGVAVGPDGNVYVTDTGNKRVLIFDGTGKYLRKIDSGMSPTKKSPDSPFNQPGELNEPVGIVVDGSNNVYVADSLNGRIQKFDSSGKPVAQWPIPNGGWNAGPYLEPFLALDSAGNLYATEPTGAKVTKFDPTGKNLGEKGTEGAISLKTPTGIAIGSDGGIYIVDTGQNGVIKFSSVP